MTASNNDLIVTPFTVLIDTREQRPYEFKGLKSDALAGRKQILVKQSQATLKSGDYSLEGHHEPPESTLRMHPPPKTIAIERKSKADLFGTVGKGRNRFFEELKRLNKFTFAAIVVEAEWSEILNDPPARSQLSAKTVFRSVIAWQQIFPVVHWHFCPGRAFGEVATFRTLERFWKEQEKVNKKP